MHHVSHWEALLWDVQTEHVPFGYDVVKLQAYWRWRGKLICQGDNYLNFLSTFCLTVEHGLLHTRSAIRPQGRKQTFVWRDQHIYTSDLLRHLLSFVDNCTFKTGQKAPHVWRAPSWPLWRDIFWSGRIFQRTVIHFEILACFIECK